MSRSNNSSSAVAISGGTSVFALLTAVFAGAKLTGYSDMSWWIVFSPLWGPTLFIIGVMLIIFVVVFLYEGAKELARVQRLKKAERKANKVDTQ